MRRDVRPFLALLLAAELASARPTRADEPPTPPRRDAPRPDASPPAEPPRADAARMKRLVFHVEATGIDVPSVRARLRDSIPANVIIVDSEEFGGAMRAAGQIEPVGKSYASRSERLALFSRLHQAMKEAPADGLVIVLMYDTPKLRVARLLVLFQDEEAPVLDQLVTLEPSKARSDAALIKASLGPILEKFAEPEPEPSAPIEPPAVAAWSAAPAEAPKPPPPTPGRRIFAAVGLRYFPGVSGFNFATGRIGIPLEKTLTVLPVLGGIYRPRPGDDFGFIAGGSVRITPQPGWFLDLAGLWAEMPKIFRFWQTSLLGGATVGKNAAGQPLLRGTLATIFERVLYSAPPSPPGREINLVSVVFTAEVRPVKHLWISPTAGFTVFDRDIARSTGGFAPLTFSYTGYPWNFLYGGFIGYDTGRFLPFVGARAHSYAGNIGYGVMIGPGLRYADGPDFFDLRLGVVMNNTKGPLSNPVLENQPLVSLDIGITL